MLQKMMTTLKVLGTFYLLLDTAICVICYYSCVYLSIFKIFNQEPCLQNRTKTESVSFSRKRHKLQHPDIVMNQTSFSQIKNLTHHELILRETLQRNHYSSFSEKQSVPLNPRMYAYYLN